MARSFASASSQYLETTSFPNATYPMTIAAWFYATSTSGLQSVAYWGNSTYTNSAGQILLNYPSGGNVASQIYGTSPSVNVLPYSGTWSINTWNHACSVMDTTAARVYLNGTVGSDVTYTARTWTSNTYLDVSLTPTAGRYLNGRVAYLGIWSAALSATEAAELAAGYHPRKVRPSALLGCWDFGGFSGEHDKDFVGGYDLTAYNSPTWVDSPRIIWPDDGEVVTLASAPTPAANNNNLLLLGAG